MLFLNVYTMDATLTQDMRYVVYALCALGVVFLLGLVTVVVFVDRPERRGVLLQGVFRSNYALIGIPLAGSLFGASGVAVASLLSAVLIPAFNVLAVISLSVFHAGGERVRVGSILLGIVKNPLIDAVAVGLLTLGVRSLFVSWGVDFRLSDIEPLFDVLSYLSALATPLALLVLGAQFEFSAIGALRREIILGVLMRAIVVPTLALGTAFVAFRDIFGGAHFAALVAAFTTPVAVSSVPMAQEMGGDSTLAGQLVVFTTISSAATVFLASFLLKLGGVF
jgi:predicted permease